MVTAEVGDVVMDTTHMIEEINSNKKISWKIMGWLLQFKEGRNLQTRG